MVKAFWQSTIAWFLGLGLGVIITSFVFKIGWENKEHILIWGYAILSSASVFAWGLLIQIKKSDMRIIDERFKAKADVKDITRLECLFENMKDSISHIENTQEEMHATIDKIYEQLLNGKTRR